MNLANIPAIQTLAAKRYIADLQLLESWANINSGTANIGGNQSMLEAIAHRFAKLPGKGGIIDLPAIASAPPSLPAAYVHRCRENAPVQVLLNGHVDTVFGPDHAFQSCQLIEGETKLKGPGVTDMKGGIVILLAALEIFETLVNEPQIGWEIVLTCDEEVGSANSRELLAQAAKRNHIGITFESSLPDQKLVRRRMGVGYARATVRGKSAHVGRDFSNGRNAIVKLSEWIQRIHNLNGKIPGTILNVGSVRGGGPLNVVSELAIAEVNLRMQDAKAEKVLIEALEDLHREVEQEGFICEWHAQVNRPAKESGQAFDRLFEAWTMAADQIGMTLAWRDTGGGSDGNLLQAAGLPIIDNLGMVGDGIHSSQEYAILSSMTDRTTLVAAFLCMLNAGTFDHKGSEPFALQLKKLQQTGISKD
jgi:glutamate carboxypeptidase